MAASASIRWQLLSQRALGSGLMGKHQENEAGARAAQTSCWMLCIRVYWNQVRLESAITLCHFRNEIYEIRCGDKSDCRFVVILLSLRLAESFRIFQNSCSLCVRSRFSCAFSRPNWTLPLWSWMTRSTAPCHRRMALCWPWAARNLAEAGTDVELHFFRKQNLNGYEW